MLRLLPPAYGDGVYAPAGADRPNPHLIAQAIFDGQTGHPSYRNCTALLVFFGETRTASVTHRRPTTEMPNLNKILYS